MWRLRKERYKRREKREIDRERDSREIFLSYYLELDGGSVGSPGDT
jgi:hypothetical protein